jgi:hypothetical protein
MTWEETTGEFLESDVIEWREIIWPPRNPRRKKPRPYGEQIVTGQIIRIEGEFVILDVLKAEITENRTAAALRPHAVGTTIKRKRQTLLKGNPERLLWSEEDVRAALLPKS